MNKHLMPVLVLALCAALIGAGCGGDDDEATTTATTTAGATGATGATGESGGGLLPDDFAAEADAICAEGDKKIDAEADEFFGGAQQEPDPADQEKFVTDVLVPGIQEQIDGLRDLDDPEEGAEEYTTFLDDAQETLDRIENDPSLVTEQFEGGGENPFADVEQQANELGLATCASDDEEESEESTGGGGTADAGGE